MVEEDKSVGVRDRPFRLPRTSAFVSSILLYFMSKWGGGAAEGPSPSVPTETQRSRSGSDDDNRGKSVAIESVVSSKPF